jgi:hypothetical protein
MVNIGPMPSVLFNQGRKRRKKRRGLKQLSLLRTYAVRKLITSILMDFLMKEESETTA